VVRFMRTAYQALQILLHFHLLHLLPFPLSFPQLLVHFHLLHLLSVSILSFFLSPIPSVRKKRAGFLLVFGTTKKKKKKKGREDDIFGDRERESMAEDRRYFFFFEKRCGIDHGCGTAVFEKRYHFFFFF
jgi:hypothetical protein